MSFSISSSKAIKACIGICLIMGLILASASEYILRVKIAPQDEFIAHVNLFNSDPVSDAAFGDSHVARGFVPPQGMLNHAYPSESIPRMAWKVDAYFSDHAPDRVIIQADPHMFAPYRLSKTVGDYPAQFENPTHSKFGLYLSIPRYRANLVNYWASFARNGGQLKSEITFTSGGAHLSPGDISKEPPRYRENAALTRARIHDLGPASTQKAYREIYSKMLTDLNRKGANICMVTFPVSPNFRTAIRTINDAERKGIFAFFEQEAQRIEARYVNWETITDDLSNFRDTDHLNGDAAKHFSPQLVTECFG